MTGSARVWQRALGARGLPFVLAALAVVLTLPSLRLGLQLDDHLLRLALTSPSPLPHWAKGPLDVFAFFTGDPALNRQHADAGVLPWWSLPDFRVAFFRPLAGLTHWIDFRAWPSHPALMHAQSLAWMAAMVAAAGVFFRRLMRPGWVAGLAALVFAVDGAHGLPAVWLANRNATLAALFGILTLVAHDAWRGRGSRAGGLLAPVLLALSLAGGELGIATCAYLLAYAIFLDDGPWRPRVVSLLPGAAVGAAWLAVYRVMGCGARGSGLYVDPGDVGAFVARVVERAPILLFGQWFLASDAYMFLSQRAALISWFAACVLLAWLAAVIWPAVRRDRVARFLACGMLLSIVPACGTFPSDRLLAFAGIGGAGLVALFLAASRDPAARLAAGRVRRLAAAAVFWLLVAFHLVLGPLGLADTARAVAAVGAVPVRAASSLPADAAVRDDQVIVVSAPSFFTTVFGPALRLLEGRPAPARMLVLASGIHPERVSRPAPNVLVIRPEGGFLLPPGMPVPGQAAPEPAFDPGHAHQTLDTLYRDAPPFRAGDRIDLTGLSVVVTDLTADGRPAEATFTFDRDLDDPSLRWLQWGDGVYAPFAVPPVGGAVTVPAPAAPWGT